MQRTNGELSWNENACFEKKPKGVHGYSMILRNAQNSQDLVHEWCQIVLLKERWIACPWLVVEVEVEKIETLQRWTIWIGRKYPQLIHGFVDHEGKQLASSSQQCHEVEVILMTTTLDVLYKSHIITLLVYNFTFIPKRKKKKKTSSSLQKYSPQETSQNFEYLILQ